MAHTVLIVDDSPTAGPELKALLEREGYNVLVALTAKEALNTLESAKIDLVITEALLPGVDGFDLVRGIRTRSSRSDVPIIMLTVRSAPEDYAAGFDAGADEYFLKPLDPLKILAANRGLIARYEAARASGALAQPGRAGVVAPVGPAKSDRGQIVTLFSLKGGTGTSTLAVNLAVAIKRLEPSARVGLIDLSLEEGADALLLDIVPTSTIADWSREDMSSVGAHLLQQYFVQHKSGVALLCAPPSPEQAEIVRPDVVRKTLELAPHVFDYVIVDTSASFSENSLIALEAAQMVLLPVTTDMTALKTAVNTMRILKAVNIDESRIRVIMNELIPRAGLTKQQIETSLDKTVTVIPFGGALLIDSANQGTPATTLESQEPVLKAIADLAASICQPEAPAEGTQRVRGGLLDRLRTGRTKPARS